ncbi:YunG family protein [Saccharopolyspora hattusasensis]|uniref:YunG family protein n=1 Tax=Saccharopolyspora hattusasensis TaxID=1128679 RepID=UPI003D99E032
MTGITLGSRVILFDVSGGCDAADMTHWNLLVLDKALRASWAADTCSPDDLARAGWQPDNPAWGHCDITALIVNDIFGGDLMVGEVHFDGEQHGFHWWNRLPTGVELDLTREQFQLGQTVTAGRVVKRPPGRLRRYEEYLLLRERLIKHLGHIPSPAL